MGEIHLDFLNFNTIILTLLILLIGGYLYYEIYKVKITLEDINLRLNYCMNNDNSACKGPLYEETFEGHVNELDSMVSTPNNDTYKEVRDIGDIGEVGDVRDVGDVGDVGDVREVGDVGDIKRQMSSDSGSDRHDSDSGSDSGSDRRDISQGEIEKDYGKQQFDKEPNNASIDDILSDKNIITDNTLSDILNVDNDLSNIDEFMLSIKNSEPKKEYNEMTVTELKKVLSDMSLPVSGNKTKLIERILENKSKIIF